MMRWSDDPPTTGTNLQFETIYLDLRRMAIKHGIGGQFLEDLKLGVDEHYDLLRREAGSMMLTLHTNVWAENLPPERVEARQTLTIEAPASWWQHLKETYAGTWWLGWLARWRPPVMNTARRVEGHLVVNLERFRVYPDAPPLAHRNGRAVQQHVLDNRAWWKDVDPDA